MHEPVPKGARMAAAGAARVFPVSRGAGQLGHLNTFQRRLGRYWRHVLRRRSQRGRITVERLTRLFDRWLIPPRLVHPYPSLRFDAMHPR